MSNIQPEGMPQFKLPRNHFDWSKKHIGSYSSGYIYPVYSRYVTPNSDTSFKIEAVIRRLPTISPSFAEERAVFRIFSVPLRVLYKDWKAWLTGQKEYSDNTPFEEDVPRWTPSNINKTGIKSLWAQLGFPVNCIPTTSPADFKRQAYAFIYDTNFRYRPIQESILNDGEPGTWKGENLLKINKDRDLFTTMLPQQQLGEPVSLPITGDTSAVFTGDGTIPVQAGDGSFTGAIYVESSPMEGVQDLKVTKTQRTSKKQLFVAGLNNNKVSIRDISSATISMMRHAFARQIQVENLARSGVFYPDVLIMNWGDAPSDEILGLPKYHGGFTVNMVNSEVLQTAPSTTESPLGEMGGHGLGVGQNSEITIHVNEHSVILVLMYIKADNYYGGQQFKEEDLFESNEAMKWVAYNHLSEQPLKKQELLCLSKNLVGRDDKGNITLGAVNVDAEKHNNEILGFQPIYEQYRTDYNTVSGLMIREQFYDTANWNTAVYNNNLYNWTNASFFSMLKGQRPAFNSDFLEYKDDMRNYAVQYKSLDGKTNEDQFIIWFNFDIAHYAVLDKYGMPGEIGINNMGVV